MLPKLFQMEDYKNCMHDEKIYCKVDAYFQPTDNNENEDWKLIKDSLANHENFDHSLIHRGYCFTTREASDFESVKKYTEVLVNREFSRRNLTSSAIDVVACTDGHIPVSSWDIIVLVSAILYISFVLFSTLKDSRERKKGNAANDLFKHFSLKRSWKKRVEPLKNEDSENLKSIQGIRCYTLLIILFFHTKMGYLLHYIENPSWMEEVKPPYNLLFVFYMFVVLTFILISSWLLTNQVLETVKKHGKFSLKHTGIMIINRYFRTAVVHAICIALYSTSLGIVVSGPLNFEMTIPQRMACKKGWLSSLLFINNFQYMVDMCNGVSWYLAADFQIYILNVAALYVILKYKLNFTKAILSIMAVSSLFYAVIIYIYDMDIIYRPSVRNFELRNFLHSFSFIVSYSSTFSILNTSFVGIIFGMIYFRTKHTKIETNGASQCLWALLFFGLPLTSVLISSKETRGISAAVLGPLVKPLFVSGIGIGILGMSHGMGGIIKRICEWRLPVIIGNFSYCIYLFQLPACFLKSPLNKNPLWLGYNEIILSFALSILISFSIGGVMTLLVEEPGISIQKMLLPQIRKPAQGNKQEDSPDVPEYKLK